MGTYHKDSYRFTLMNYLFYVCIIPTRALRIMGNTTHAVQKQVNSMEKDGWIKKEKPFDRRLLTLSFAPKYYSRYEEVFFGEYNACYSRIKKNFYRTETSLTNRLKMQRLQQIAETSIFAAEAGIKTFPEEKIELNEDSLYWYDASFYQSLEIKDEMEFAEARASASRMTGCVFWENRITPVYSLSDDIIKIGDITEKIMVERLFMNFSEKVHKLKISDALLFTWKYDKVHSKLSLSGNFGSYFYLSDTYKDYYLIPYTREGKKLLQLLYSDYGKEELMNMIVRKNWKIQQEQMSIEADGIDENGIYIFNYLIPNILRLKKFLVAAKAMQEKKFHIFCYTFQKSALEKEITSNVTLSCYEYDVVDELCKKRILRRVGSYEENAR